MIVIYAMSFELNISILKLNLNLKQNDVGFCLLFKQFNKNIFNSAGIKVMTKQIVITM